MRPTNLNGFKLPTHRLERSVDALIDLIGRHWSALMMLAVFAIWAGVMDADFQEATADERRAVAEAQAQRDELAGWVSQNRVRVVLEGEPGRVANLAQQIANVVTTERK